ncbi:MAG: AAA family ATPase [Dehalococcoidia bacterium]
MTTEELAPLLILVNGRPATGKSGIAAQLSEALDVALFTKDEVKELLGDVLGAPDREAAHALGEASIALIFQHAEAVLATGAPAMVECPLIPEFTVPILRGIEERTGCRLLQLFLVANPAVIVERYRNRERSEVHFDAEALRELERSLAEESIPPVPVSGATWTIDTTDFRSVEVDALAERIRERIAAAD